MSDAGENLILSVNAGSSSLKIALYKLLSDKSPVRPAGEPISLLLTSSISSISSPPAEFSFQLVSSSSDNANKTRDNDAIHHITNHASAFAVFLDVLKREAKIDKDQITHTCHRVVHGGDYTDPVVISEESYHHIEKLSDLAPLYVRSASQPGSEYLHVESQA
jgi:acetate kinase